MKSISVFLSICLFYLNCSSQSLEGEWRGTFTLFNPDPSAFGGSTNQNACWPMSGYVNLKFILKKDSSYTVYSSFKGSDTITVCEVLYKRIDKDKIYLEETKILKPEFKQMSRGFQKMNLKIKQRKKSIHLIGTFNYISGGSCKILIPGMYYGDISFYKKTERKSR